MRGDFIPRNIAGKGYIIFAIMRSLYLAISIVASVWFAGARFDVLVVDQLSASIPILRLTGAKVQYMYILREDSSF